MECSLSQSRADIKQNDLMNNTAIVVFLTHILTYNDYEPIIT